MQEIALSRNAIVKAGGLEIEWSLFVDARDAVFKHRSCCEYILTDPDWEFGWRDISTMGYAIPDVGYSLQDNLADSTFMCRSRVASDPRDKIFSLLNIVNKFPFWPPHGNPIKGPRLEMKPDYNLSEQEVFRLATLETIRDYRSLEVLILSGDFSGRPGFPSWVADFRYRHTVGKWLHNRYNCSLGTTGDLEMCSPQKLRVVGVPYQPVGEVGPRLRYHVDPFSAKCIKETHETISAWEKMRDNPQVKRTVYKSMKGRNEAFWQTIWGGYSSLTGSTLHPKDQEVYDNWRQWVKYEATGHSRFSWQYRNINRHNARLLQRRMTAETASFFVTDRGWFGMAYPAAEPDDCVVVFGLSGIV